MRSPNRKKSRNSVGSRAKRYGSVVIVLVLVVAGGLLGLELYRLATHAFPLKEIILSGNRHISDAELKSLTGLHPGTGLLTISLKRVSERLLLSPWIKAVSIRKDFPDRLHIKICEVSPFAILDRNGQAFLINEKGRTLEKIDGDSVPFLPIITTDPARTPENFAEAMRLAGVIREKKIATERGRVEIVANGKGPEDIAVIVDSVVIKVGAGDYEQKLDRLFAIEDEIKKRAITIDYVDLRFANRIVVKPINEVIR